MKYSVVIPAAGAAERFGEEKLRLPYAGGEVWQAAVGVFEEDEDAVEIFLVVPEDKVANYHPNSAKCTVIAGGKTRAESVRNALLHVTEDYVLVHDGARPNLDRALVRRVVEALETHDAVVPVVGATDSMLYQGNYVDRKEVQAVQTPQGFLTSLLRECVAQADGDYTDEGSLVEKVCPAYRVDGDVNNRKLTYPVDYYGLAGRTVTGVGYDIHRLTEGDGITLGGVKIPCDKKAVAHSDGDCVLHAVMDAALSTAGLKDIGHYFPNTPEWKDADSRRMLGIVLDEVKAKGCVPTAISVAVVCEAPKLSPYFDGMRESLADLMGIRPSDVGITCTTNEGVAMRVNDLVTSEAIAAFATVTALRKAR